MSDGSAAPASASAPTSSVQEPENVIVNLQTVSSPSPMKPENEPIAFVDLHAQYTRLKPDIDARIAAVLAHGRFILGPQVTAPEPALAGQSTRLKYRHQRASRK